MTGRSMTIEARGVFLQALYEALRSVRARGASTSGTGAALDRLRAACDPLLTPQRGLELRLTRRTLFVNGVALGRDVSNFVFYSRVLDVLSGAGVGQVTFDGLPTRRDLELFIGLVARTSQPDADPTRLARLRRSMASQNVRGIDVHPPLPGPATDDADARRVARRTYEESVSTSRALFGDARMGRSTDVGEVKHAVQNIVDGVLTNEASLGGLSTLKDFDDYAFTHAVNVCILSVAIGRRLGLSKSRLYDLGHAALVHDIGMSRIPHEILTKGTALTPEERAEMEAHTWLGALSVFDLRDLGEVPYQSMIVAYEHHMKDDGTGYPPVIRPRERSIFSRIVSVVAAFDAATNERSYSRARPADEVLREFRDRNDFGFDPVVVKALINLLGIYPVGSLVILDTCELGIVHQANSDPSFPERPIVRLVTDADGAHMTAPPLVDLTETDEEGRFVRTIVTLTDPEPYGIAVSEYLT